MRVVLLRAVGAVAGTPRAARKAKAVAPRKTKAAKTKAIAPRPARSPVDTYLAGVPAAKRALLEPLRRAILAVVPRAEECLSYGIAAFRVDGKVVAGFLATRPGGSYFPFSGTTLDSLGDALEGWSRTKSGLHFTEAQPIPRALLRKLIAARLAEIKQSR